MNKQTICLDFDGVCHSYSGWKGETIIDGEPIDGLFDFLESAFEHFEIVIFTTRAKSEEGQIAIGKWFHEKRNQWRKTESGKNAKEIRTLSITDKKPPAVVYIDDRAITFNGTWPTIQELKNFKPWYK